MATERLAPDAILVQTGLSGSVTAIDEDPDSPDASWLTSSVGTNTDLRVSFPLPSGNLNTGAGLQEFRVRVRKTTGSTAPTCVVELWENGSLVTTVVASTSVTSTTGVVLSGTWDASLLSNISGANVECRVVGTVGGGNPGNRAAVEVGAVEWNDNYIIPAPPATPPKPVVSIGSEQIVVSGYSVSGATSYDIYRDPGTGTFVLIVTSHPSTTYTDTDASVIVTNSVAYKVVAKNGAGSSAQSVASDYVDASPTAPSDFSLQRASGQVTVSIVKKPYDTKYKVYRGGTLVHTSTLQTGGSGTYDFVDTGLTNGTTYFYSTSVEVQTPVVQESSQTSSKSVVPTPVVILRPGSIDSTFNWTSFGGGSISDQSDASGITFAAEASATYLSNGIGSAQINGSFSAKLFVRNNNQGATNLNTYSVVIQVAGSNAFTTSTAENFNTGGIANDEFSFGASALGSGDLTDLTFAVNGSLNGGAENPKIYEVWLEIPVVETGTPIGKEVGLVWNVSQPPAFKTLQFAWNDKATLFDSLQLVWNITTPIFDALQLAWGVRNFVGDPAQFVWNTKAAAPDSLQLVWRDAAIISDSLQAVWNTLITTNDQLQEVWNVRTASGDAIQGLWNVKSITADSLQAMWNIKSAIADTISVAWNVRSFVSDDMQLVWNVELAALIATKTLQAAWNVNAFANDSLDAQWRVLVAQSDLLQAIWNVKQTSGDSLFTVWDARALAADSLDAQWRVLIASSDSLSLTWNVKAITGDELFVEWNVLANQLFATKDLSLRWNLIAHLGDDLSLDWNVLAAANQELVVRWRVLTAMFDSIGLSWNTLATAVDQFEADWSVAELVSDQISARWDTASIADKSLILQWAILASSSGLLDLRWRDLETAQDSLGIQWGVSTKVTEDLNLLWSIKEAVGSLLEFLWKTLSNLADKGFYIGPFIIAEYIDILSKAFLINEEFVSSVWVKTSPLGELTLVIDHIEVIEGNDPTLRFQVTYQELNATTGVKQTTARNLTGYQSIELFLKATPETADPAPILGTIVDAVNGVVEFALTSAQIGSVGRQWIRVDTIDGTGRRLTVYTGTFEVGNG